jgi:alkylation response protein AidB-like acyl-CoA dehydrogenase
MVTPHEYGGAGATAENLCDVLEGLGEGCSSDGLYLALGAHLWAVIMPLIHFGTDEQKKRYLPRLVNGAWIAAHAASESHGGSNAMGLRTRYEAAEGGFVLNGVKEFVTNAPCADLFVVFATRDPALGFQGVSAFLVQRTDPGVVVGPDERKMGLQAAALSSVTLEDCSIPADRMLGAPGGARDVFATAMLWERTLILAPQVGAMKSQLLRCIEYATTRRINARPIGKQQMIAARIADMYARYITARALLRDSVALLDAGRMPPARASVVKLMLAEWSVVQHMDALRIHGGPAYLTEFGIEAQVRGAIGGLLYSGTSEIQRVIISGDLGL